MTSALILMLNLTFGCSMLTFPSTSLASSSSFKITKASSLLRGYSRAECNSVYSLTFNPNMDLLVSFGFNIFLTVTPYLCLHSFSRERDFSSHRHAPNRFLSFFRQSHIPSLFVLILHSVFDWDICEQ